MQKQHKNVFKFNWDFEQYVIYKQDKELMHESHGTVSKSIWVQRMSRVPCAMSENCDFPIFWNQNELSLSYIGLWNIQYRQMEWLTRNPLTIAEIHQNKKE